MLTKERISISERVLTKKKNNWRRSAEQELRQIGLRWTQIEHQAQDRDQWKKTVDELCFT